MLFTRTSRRPRAGINASLAILSAVACLLLGAPSSRAAAQPLANFDPASVHWVQVGATVDPTRGQAPVYSAHHGMSFAELLEAGANAGLRPDLTQLLGLPRGPYGMAMETAILIRLPGSPRVFVIYKNDVGSGQRHQRYYKIDLHPGIARALGVSPYLFKGTVQVAVVPGTAIARDAGPRVRR